MSRPLLHIYLCNYVLYNIYILIHMVQPCRCRYRSQTGHVSIDSLQIPLLENFFCFAQNTHLRCNRFFYTPNTRGTAGWAYPSAIEHLRDELDDILTYWQQLGSFVLRISRKKKSPKRLPKTTLLIGKC